VLAATGGSVGSLGRIDPGELRRIPGIGDVGAARIVAAVELGKRVAGARPSPGRPIAGPGDVWRIMRMELGDLAHEEFHVLLLNAQNVPLRSRLVTRGILDASLIHPREVFRDAIVQRAASLVLVHNHPSGDPEPSGEDLRVTQQLVRAGDEVGIPVVDHVIVAASAYVSLAARGRLRPEGPVDAVPWRVRDPVCSRRDGLAVGPNPA
jgi:DNA repair protein RadC